MSEKRKDSRGRILKDGESQRKNGTYMYRYADIHKRRKYVYAKTLEDLRKQEELVKRDLADGIDYAAGEITVAELVDRYFSLKRGLKQNSLRAYGTAIKRSQSSSSRSAVQQAIIDCSDYIKMVQKARKIKVFRAFAISKRADMV